MTAALTPGRPGPRRGTARRRDDAGGVWIVTGIVLGVLMYGFIVLMAVAGFSPVVPLVIIPPVVLGLIAANNLLNGGRGYGRPAPVPLSPDDRDGPPAREGAGGSDRTDAPGRHAAGESQPPQ